MNYFRFFPQTPYTLRTTNSVFELSMTQITAHLHIAEKLRQNINVLYDYVIEGEERPDNVSERLYGSPQYTWVLLLLNNITSLFDWPLDSVDFNDYIITKYGSVEAAESQFVYRTADRIVVDKTTFDLLLSDQRGVVHSQYDEEITLNDAKRRIRIVPAAFMPSLQKELASLFQ